MFTDALLSANSVLRGKNKILSTFHSLYPFIFPLYQSDCGLEILFRHGMHLLTSRV